jgi:hypothetical protein
MEQSQQQSNQPQILRQPRTFWQWLSGQEGTLFVPLAPIVKMNPGRTTLDAIESAIEQLHTEMNELRDSEFTEGNDSYQMLVQTLGKLHSELIRRSKDETSGPVSN